MNISYDWLQEYTADDLPAPQRLAEKLTMHAYEVEGIEKVGDDYVLDIDVLPNRAADSLSHIGVARELVTLLDQGLDIGHNQPDTTPDLSTETKVDLTAESSKVRRAAKRIVADVSVEPSPDYIQRRLQAVGHAPINNIVDITNYVMLETGQPVHAFDYDKLAGDAPKEVSIREAREGETITTLDEETYQLRPGMLVIADEDKPLDIAGIKGGMNSHIDESTTRVLLSVCNFDPASVRNTSQKLNLRTDALKRFENNISPETVDSGMKRLSQLISKDAGGQVAEDTVDIYPRPANQYVTGTTAERINNVLGTDITQEKVKEILKRCHCEVDTVDPTRQVLEHAREYEGTDYERGASVSFDAPNKFDCSSYISFLFSQFGGISIPRVSVDQFVFGNSIDEENMKAGDVIFSNTGNGQIYTETQEYMPGTEVSEGVDHCGLYLGDGMVIHATKKSGEVVIQKLEESSRFSNTVGIRRMADGKRLRVQVPYWRQDLRRPEDIIEEVGRVYGYEQIDETVPEPVDDTLDVHKVFYYVQKIRDTLTSQGLSEVYTYAFQDEGSVALKNPIAEDKAYLRESLKSGLTQALKKNKKHQELLDGQEISVFEIGNVFKKDQELLQLGLAQTNGSQIISKALKQLAENLDINSSVIETNSTDEEGVTLMNLQAVIDELKKPESYDDLQTLSTNTTYEPPSEFPYVLRDIAFWAPQEIKSQKEKVKKLLQEVAGDLLVNINLFDQYDPEDQYRVSLAFRLVFQSNKRTLEDEEVNRMMEKVRESLEKEGWEVR